MESSSLLWFVRVPFLYLMSRRLVFCRQPKFLHPYTPTPEHQVLLADLVSMVCPAFQLAPARSSCRSMGLNDRQHGALKDGLKRLPRCERYGILGRVMFLFILRCPVSARIRPKLHADIATRAAQVQTQPGSLLNPASVAEISLDTLFRALVRTILEIPVVDVDRNQSKAMIG